MFDSGECFPTTNFYSKNTFVHFTKLNIYWHFCIHVKYLIKDPQIMIANKPNLKTRKTTQYIRIPV